MKKQNRNLTIIIITLAIIVWFGLSQGLGYLYREFLMGESKNTLDMVMLTMILPYGVALPISFLILKTRIKGTQKIQSLSWKDTARSFVIQSGFSIPVMVIVNMITVAITGAPGGMDTDAITNNLVFYLILLLIFNPIMEEVLFRKLVLDRFLPYGEKFAILFTSILFALPHIYSQGISGACYTFILAIVWGRITVKSGSIKQAVILHSLSNVWGCFLPMLLTANKSTMPIYFLVFVIGMPIAAIVTVVKRKEKMSVKGQ